MFRSQLVLRCCCAPCVAHNKEQAGTAEVRRGEVKVVERKYATKSYNLNFVVEKEIVVWEPYLVVGGR